jgi:hypothetical protein
VMDAERQAHQQRQQARIGDRRASVGG